MHPHFVPSAEILTKYAHLLLHYCLQLQEGKRLFVSSTLLAEPLLQAIHREATRIGSAVEYDLSFSNKSRIYWQEATNAVLDMEPLVHQFAMEHFDAYLAIRAPFDLYEDLQATADQKKRRAAAAKAANDFYFKRTGDGSMVRSLCQYPTQASA